MRHERTHSSYAAAQLLANDATDIRADAFEAAIVKSQEADY